ncbi:MAG: YceI family protein [Hyalangium sp.]|uniref:YceI family protein n=1 Tax=Hyalangium sp. TaxID=2028555 RepID=UPI00389A109D
MKTLMKSALAIAALSVPSLAMAASYEIDAPHSNAGFAVKHMMVSNVRGSFSKMTGTLDLDDKDITKSTVAVTIDTTTIDTGVAARDTHLKSKDFFDVEKFPTITFKSKKVEKAGEGQLKVTGDLTMHGVTKEVVLDVEGPSKEAKDPQGKIRIGATATTTLHRKDFGLTYNAALETGGVAVGDDVKVTLDLEAVKKAATPANTTAKDAK